MKKKRKIRTGIPAVCFSLVLILSGMSSPALPLHADSPVLPAVVNAEAAETGRADSFAGSAINGKMISRHDLRQSIVASSQTVSAAEETSNSSLVVDNAGLLDDDERQELSDQLQEISDRQECAVVVLTENSIDSDDPKMYAADYYDSHGYGYGSDKTGIILLLDMGERHWAIATTGEAIADFTDAGQEYITDQIVSYFSDGDYYQGFSEFADLCDQFLTQAADGEPYDTGNMPDDTEMAAGTKWLILLIVAVGIGLLIALIRVSVMKRKLKSVSIAKAANAYVKGGEVNLTDQNDIFLYHTVDRVPKPRDNNSGGSSTFTGSSGTAHGGSSGSF